MLHATVRSLPLFLLTLVLAPLRAQDPDQAPTAPPPSPPPAAAPFRPIQAPSDPAKTRGTYEIEGREVTVTEGEFYDTYQLLKPHEEKREMPLQPPRILEHILLLAEAQALGLEPTPEEVALINPVKSNPTLGGQMMERLKALGVTEAQYERYLRETRAIARLKDWWASSSHVRSQEAYEAWKRENLLHQIEYVAFSARDEESRLRQSVPEERALKEFWSSNAEVQARFRTPSTVTVEVVSFDVSALPSDEVRRRLTERPVDRAEALAYFQAHRDRLMGQIPSDQRPRLYPPDGTRPKVDEIVTPFEILRPQIEREIRLAGGIEAAHRAASDQGAAANLEAIARGHGLSYILVEDADRARLHSVCGHLGPAIFQEVFAAEPGQLGATIHRQTDLAWFWRVKGRKAASLPEFESIREQLLEAWYAAEAFARARSSAKELLDAVEAAGVAQFQAEFAQIDAETQTQIDRELAEKNPSDPGERELIKQKHLGMAEARKRRIRQGRPDSHFETEVAARGLELRTLEPFAFSFHSLDRSIITDPVEQARAFFKTAHQVRAMEPGQVSPILSDTVTNTHFVVRLKSRAEPDFTAMPVVEYHQRRSILERNAVFSSGFRWSYFQVQKRRNWKEQ
jgi:hypothetical protein